MRALYGLPAKRADVQALLASSKDVGTDEHGVPMTADELKKVDPNGRAVFSAQVRRDVLPWLEKQPGYAGAWIDQKNNGQLVVAYTKSKVSIEAGIEARMPQGKRGSEVQRADHTWDELTAAVEKALDVASRMPVGSALAMASVDVENNRVQLYFPEAKLGAAKSSKQAWQEALGVPVRIGVGNAPVDTVSICTKPADSNNRSQANCWKPIPAGVRTHSFSKTGRKCTMAWQIYKASANPPTQFLTAGHCIHEWDGNGNKYGNTKIWHNGSFHGGQAMGVRKSTLYNGSDHLDAARVALDWSTGHTEKLYDRPNANVLFHSGVLANDPIKFLGATTKKVKTTTVGSASACWKSETWKNNHSSKLRVCGAKTIGGSTKVRSLPGDSGAPVYTKRKTNGVVFLTPVGIVSGNDPDDTGPMVFTLLEDAFTEWNGWAVRTFWYP